MTDIFDAKILCKNCDKEMKRGIVKREGTEIRAVKCDECGDVIIHPADLNCLEQFRDLKGKVFNVKLRVVGNSHAIRRICLNYSLWTRLLRNNQKQLKPRYHTMHRIVYCWILTRCQKNRRTSRNLKMKSFLMQAPEGLQIY